MIFEVNSLVKAGLVRESTYITEGQHLKVYTAEARVYSEDLWGTDARLKECRGIMVNINNVVQTMPFFRLRPYEELAKYLEKFEPIVAVEKIDGFLACVSWVKRTRVVSVDGMTSGKYVDMANEYLDKVFPPSNLPRYMHATTMFEICHPDATQTIPEEYGAYLIGQRWHGGKGNFSSEKSLDMIAKTLNVRRPAWMCMRLNQAIQMSKKCKHEGYIIRKYLNGEPVCTLQSPHFKGKRRLLELSNVDVDQMYNYPGAFAKTLDPEFRAFMYYVLMEFSLREWKGLCASDRRIVLEEYTWGEV